MPGAAWTADDDRLLRELVAAGFSNAEIGPRLNRTRGSIGTRVVRRRLASPERPVRERSGLLRAVRTALADGRWHGIHELVGLVGETIPPERALRVFSGGGDLAARIYSGRRSKVSSALSKIPGVERRGPFREREYRLPA